MSDLSFECYIQILKVTFINRIEIETIEICVE